MQPTQEDYDLVAAELAQKNIKPGLWARALAETGTGDDRAKARYIQLRTDECAAERESKLSAEAEVADKAVASKAQEKEPSPIADTPPDFIEIRKRHLSHEANISQLGALFLIGAVLTLMPLIKFMTNPSYFNFKSDLEANVGLAALLLLLALQIWIGLRLRKIDRVAKTPAIISGFLGLLYFPWGTITGAYVLYLLLSAKGKYVFSSEYRAVISATPEIRYKLSGVTVALIIVTLTLLFFGLLLMIFKQ